MKTSHISILGLILALNCPLAQTLSAAEEQMVPLNLVLPAPAYKGTPKDLGLGDSVEPVSTNARPAIMVPAGLTNIGLRAKLTSSDKNASAEKLGKIINGEKASNDETIVYLRKGIQWVQMDFDKPQEIFAIVIWHANDTQKVYRDVVVQAADDSDLIENVRTLFNNDQDNSSGLGVGTNREYFESHEGKLLDTKGIKASSLRFSSKGSTDSSLNEYTEIEVYGRPAK